MPRFEACPHCADTGLFVWVGADWSTRVKTCHCAAGRAGRRREIARDVLGWALFLGAIGAVLCWLARAF